VLVVDAHDHVAEHVDQPAVGVVGEALVAGGVRQALDRLVVEAEVEDGVHHARHGDGGAGAHRDQQRVGVVAELLAGLLLEQDDRLRTSSIRPPGSLRPARSTRRTTSVVMVKPGGHGQADGGHLGEVGALAAQQQTWAFIGPAGSR
jgi:hypothetical protein